MKRPSSPLDPIDTTPKEEEKSLAKIQQIKTKRIIAAKKYYGETSPHLSCLLFGMGAKIILTAKAEVPGNNPLHKRTMGKNDHALSESCQSECGPGGSLYDIKSI